MKLNEYINWHKLWDENFDLSLAKDSFGEDSENYWILCSFEKEDNLELLESECYIDDGEFNIFFSESGGQNESDTQGWSRDYTFTFSKEFDLIEVSYEQG